MKFIDSTHIKVSAGKGGDGVVSFRHEYRIERGGPDGGDGGKGGNIYFKGDTGMNTLLQLHLTKHIRGFDGVNGGSKNMTGAGGKDSIITVPIGTSVYENDKLLVDIVDDQKYLIVKGGIGGKGNTRFKSSRNLAPKIYENGTKGESKELILKLKVMADIGLVGKPSAGKSTLLSVISNAKTKVGDYDFTTLIPQLGLVRSYDNSFSAADLPGLIAGAASGKGLGIRFLQHIERCRVIGFVLDFGSESKNPIEDFETLKTELSGYNLKLLEKTFLIIANKMDMEIFESNYKKFIKKYPKLPIVKISAITKNNLEELKSKMFKLIQEAKNISIEKEEKDEVFIEMKSDYEIVKKHEGLYEISGEKIESIYQKNPLNSWENILRFNKKVKDIGLWKALIKKGIKKGDEVRILNYQFTWEEDYDK